jgi:hypothetical protein
MDNSDTVLFNARFSKTAKRRQSESFAFSPFVLFENSASKSRRAQKGQGKTRDVRHCVFDVEVAFRPSR